MKNFKKYFHSLVGWPIKDQFFIVLKLFFMFIRGIWYYLLFKKVRGLVLVGKNVKIRNPWHISTNGTVIFEDYCEVQGLSKRGITFGKNVTVGRFAVIRPSGYYGREIGEGLLIKDNSNIGTFNYIGCSGFIEIGENVMLSPRVSIYSENHNFENTEIPMKVQGVTRGVTIIEDDCWIASNSIILSNVIIGKGSIIAAGSIVTKNVEKYSIVAGNPAKTIKKRK